jgi:hypothetical protein
MENDDKPEEFGDPMKIRNPIHDSGMTIPHVHPYTYRLLAGQIRYGISACVLFW